MGGAVYQTLPPFGWCSHAPIGAASRRRGGGRRLRSCGQSCSDGRLRRPPESPSVRVASRNVGVGRRGRRGSGGTRSCLLPRHRGGGGLCRQSRGGSWRALTAMPTVGRPEGPLCRSIAAIPVDAGDVLRARWLCRCFLVGAQECAVGSAHPLLRPCFLCRRVYPRDEKAVGRNPPCPPALDVNPSSKRCVKDVYSCTCVHEWCAALALLAQTTRTGLGARRAVRAPLPHLI